MNISLFFCTEEIEQDAACDDEEDGKDSGGCQFFAEEEPGNQCGGQDAHAAPGGIGESQVQGREGPGEGEEAETVGNEAARGGQDEGEAMGHFKEGGAGEFHGNGKEHEKIGHRGFLSIEKPAPHGAGRS